MNSFLFTAITLVALTAAAQAEIMCTHNGGCWETGMRIYNNGAAYQWLPVINHRDDGRPKKPVRIINTPARRMLEPARLPRASCTVVVAARKKLGELVKDA